jgi:hypothetical protein
VSVSLENKKARYRVTSTVFLKMHSNNESYGNLEIAGNLSRTVISNLLINNPLLERRDL